MDETPDKGNPAERADEPAPAPEPVPENHAPNPNQRADEGERDEAPADDGSTNFPPPANPFDTSMLRWTRIVGFFTAVLALVGISQKWAFIQKGKAADVAPK